MKYLWIDLINFILFISIVQSETLKVLEKFLIIKSFTTGSFSRRTKFISHQIIIFTLFISLIIFFCNSIDPNEYIK